MKTSPVLELPQVSAGCFALTHEQAAALFTPAELAAKESRLDVRTVGPWGIPVSAVGLVVSFNYEADKANNYSNPRQPLRVYGRRTMTNWKQTGFEAEGVASVDGRKRRVFTSSKLFQLPDGSLISASVLHLGNS